MFAADCADLYVWQGGYESHKPALQLPAGELDIAGLAPFMELQSSAIAEAALMLIATCAFAVPVDTVIAIDFQFACISAFGAVF